MTRRSPRSRTSRRRAVAQKSSETRCVAPSACHDGATQREQCDRFGCFPAMAVRPLKDQRVGTVNPKGSLPETLKRYSKLYTIPCTLAFAKRYTMMYTKCDEGTVAIKSISAKDARAGLPRILDDAASGQSTMIIRNSRPTAAVVPAQLAELLPLVHSIMKELGESIQLSRDPEVLEAYRRGQTELENQDIEWYEV